MNGLNLETFLRLLRADLAAWGTLAAILGLFAFLTWTSWGPRRLLRRCLVASLIVHAVLVVSRTHLPLPLGFAGGLSRLEASEDGAQHIRQIRVEPVAAGGEADGTEDADTSTGPGGRRAAASAFDQPGESPEMTSPELRAEAPELPANELAALPPDPGPPLAPEANAPEVETPSPAVPESLPLLASDAAAEPETPDQTVPGDLTEIPEIVVPPGVGSESPAESVADSSPLLEGSPIRSEGTSEAGSAGSLTARGTSIPGSTATLPDTSTRLRPRRGVGGTLGSPGGGSGMLTGPVGGRGEGAPVPVPRARLGEPTVARLDIPRGALSPRGLPDVPEVYRPRLDPNRSLRAQRAGGSKASEEAVERALVWLEQHQDSDGRWDAGMRQRNGTPLRGEDDFTVHCPPGDICFGECFYWEADSAMTGLALLAYLGAGYTHLDGPHADTIDQGLRFLLRIQKADGDLRGESQAVGMYCHAMASLALCEAYALTGDPTLREPVERAVRFLIDARSADRMAWRYLPNDPRGGDTSILGWVILVLKSARENRIPIPPEIDAGAERWLKVVSTGPDDGLAIYRPQYQVTPTMTAEAWVCRQFLGIGGPGAASDEAARYLLEHGPDEEPYNIYYWYYGTLAMYQHGGEPWERWNGMVRDRIVARQRTDGHAAGSWDPDDTQWGSRGGRIYATALATLTLEVYYRYLRLYDDPAVPPALAPKPGNDRDSSLRRAGDRPARTPSGRR